VEADEVAQPNKTSSALHYNVASFEEGRMKSTEGAACRAQGRGSRAVEKAEAEFPYLLSSRRNQIWR
jgi:hypothetical protein